MIVLFLYSVYRFLDSLFGRFLIKYTYMKNKTRLKSMKGKNPRYLQWQIIFHSKQNHRNENRFNFLQRFIIEMLASFLYSEGSRNISNTLYHPGSFLSQNTRRIFIFNRVFKPDKNDEAFQSVDIFAFCHSIEWTLKH